jgi:hypothetical protein
MTRTPRSSTKRIAPAEAAKKVTKPARKPSKPSKPGKQQTTKVSKAMIKPKTPVQIKIARTEITYDSELAEAKGYLRISDGTPRLKPPNGDTLLHLLFFLIYTQDGFDLLRANGPTTAATPAQAKENLKAQLLLRFPTIETGRPDSVLDPVIEAHFAADQYVEAVNQNDSKAQVEYREAYSQKLLAILGELHDDAMAHEFSMLW